MNKANSFAFNRRNFLRGIGACLALPAMESLIPTKLFAADTVKRLATTATGAPLRSAFIFFPNGAIPGAWWPEGQGSDFKLGSTLQPLEQVRSGIQVMGGLDHATRWAAQTGQGTMRAGPVFS